MIDFIKNNTIYLNKYKTHSEAIIISCFYNPQNSPYRLKAFNKFYDSIKHLNHHIIECVIGKSEPQLPITNSIKRIYTDNLLWHKESILNKIVSGLPAKYKYIFWIDADVMFTNLNWLVEGVEELQTENIIQPFEYGIHLEKDQNYPIEFQHSMYPNIYNKNVWKSFASNYANNNLWKDENYDNHGHVGFAWGARREILDAVPLYDKALIGGADHIIAHAAAGQICHKCISKSFTDNLDEVNDWSTKFYNVAKGKIGYVNGDLYHIWHGDLKNRQYLKRIQDFTPKTKTIIDKDHNGLYITNTEDDEYIKKYYKQREASDDGFLQSMVIGYATDSTIIGSAVGGNVMGAMIGDLLNNNDINDINSGGEFGGAGASGDFDSNNNTTENFS